MLAISRYVQCLALCIGVLANAQRGESFALPRRATGYLVNTNPNRTPSCGVEILKSSAVSSEEQESSFRGGGGVQKKDAFWNAKLLRVLFAEAAGTFIIVQLGTGAVMSAIFDDALVGLMQIAAVWVIAVTLAIATTGPISGAHLNPAVSIAMSLLRPSSSFGFGKVLLYIASQLIGAISGSLINLLLYKEKILQFEAKNSIVRGTTASIASAKAFGEYFAEPISASLAFLVELFGTAMLSFAIFALTNPKNDTQKNGVYIPPLIGLTVGGLICVLAPLTQAGFNPARDFGPRIVAFFAGWKMIAFQGWWVYVFAPIIGALLGGFVADKVLYGGDDN
ncbi:Glycerol uptake facilitator protein-like [Seminavis robusta]|uniref:Glycerol uptake facilitator protein-like n=1 Tax=Seminavis robusta TaxID=568900 RepID=A0A9N8D9G2_9STRA|nr:Glycerol uptake facilitator protein-like [Seminavis robusta]|eukprot:Sro23_g015990.1 Glycerol uptake facilitator protein-like (337) ;mRNA; f:127670-129119